MRRCRLIGWVLPNPDISGGFALVALALLVSAMGSCVAAIEGKGQTLGQRTAEWYARPENDATRSAIVEVCGNDSALARQNGDCINAHQGQLFAAEREGRRRLDLSPPTQPQYWRARPAEREHHLRVICPGLTPLEQRQVHCDVARRS